MVQSLFLARIKTVDYVCYKYTSSCSWVAAQTWIMHILLFSILLNVYTCFRMAVVYYFLFCTFIGATTQIPYGGDWVEHKIQVEVYYYCSTTHISIVLSCKVNDCHVFPTSSTIGGRFWLLVKHTRCSMCLYFIVDTIREIFPLCVIYRDNKNEHNTVYAISGSFWTHTHLLASLLHMS